MFIVKPNESDFWTALESGMLKNASFDGNLEKEQVDKALDYLTSAAASLNNAGLKKEAEMVMVVKEMCSDPHTKDLTPEKMVKNLKEKGIMFDADDEDFEDEQDLEVEDLAVKEAAEYQGKQVKLNDPVRNEPGSPKKFHVFVKGPGGKVKKVQFGDPEMEIKRDDPDRLKSFRSRHNCDNPGPKDKARYWSCYQWRKGKKVDSQLDKMVDEFVKAAASTS